MSDYVPSEVYSEILLRLPAESLLRLRSVCKAWLHLIDDPTFVKSHQLFSSNNNNNLLIRDLKGAPLYLIDLDSIDFNKSDRQLIDTIPLKQLIRPEVPFAEYKRKTCNGLILISSYKIKKIWAIWNPLTQSCHQLPTPPDAADLFSEDGELFFIPATGLGYDFDADDYKVVRIDRLTCNGVTVYRTLVYSLNSGCWRRIKDCPYNFWSEFWCDDRGDSSTWCDHNGVFLNGAIHWLYRDVVYVLDVCTEDYRQLALPPPLATIKKGYDFHLKFDAIGGCLSLTLSDHVGLQFTGWVMKDYGADWVRLFTFDMEGACSLFGGIPSRLVAFLDSKKQVIFQQGRGFLWYDVENGDVKRFTVHGLTISSSQICPGSIYRLDDSDSVCGNVGSEKRTSERTRWTVCLRDCDTEYCSDSSCQPNYPYLNWVEQWGA